jgi:hypothetical protein
MIACPDVAELSLKGLVALLFTFEASSCSVCLVHKGIIANSLRSALFSHMEPTPTCNNYVEMPQ